MHTNETNNRTRFEYQCKTEHLTYLVMYFFYSRVNTIEYLNLNISRSIYDFLPINYIVWFYSYRSYLVCDLIRVIAKLQKYICNN